MLIIRNQQQIIYNVKGLALKSQSFHFQLCLHSSILINIHPFHLMPPGVIAALRHPDTETVCVLPTSRHAKKTEQDCYPLRISHHSNHSHFFRISFYDPNGRLRTKIRNKTVSMLSITRLFSSLPSKEMQNSSQYSTGNY